MNTTERTLLDAIEVPVFALEPDADGRPVYVAFNKIACQIANLSAANIIGRTALDVYPGQFGQTAYERHCKTIASREAVTYQLTLPFDGKERQVQTHLKPVLDDQGSLIRLIGTSSDISAEYAVRKVQANSELLNSELEHFVNLAAHDLRSPILNIQTLTDLLREGFQDLGDGKLKIVNMLEKVAVNATALIGDVISHAQATGTPEAIEEFEMIELCRDTLLMLDPTEKHRLVAQDCRIFGDKVATQVVLRNLIDNAIKHNTDQSISMSVSAKPVNTDMYQITVEDNGVGFPNPAVAFLGGGKFQSDSGFGLLGIQRLVRARGGEIVAEKPMTGLGSVVKLTLPGKILARLNFADTA